APWLDAVTVTVPVWVARAELDRESLGRLRTRDVLIATRIGRTGEVDLRIGRGGLRGALATGGGRVTVLSSYSRDAMTRPSQTMQPWMSRSRSAISGCPSGRCSS